MNDTPTPRTDEWLAEEKRNPRISGLGNWIDYCKTLERELTTITAQRDGLHELHNQNAARSKELLELCGTLREQRDRLAEALRVATACPLTETWYKQAIEALDALKPCE
jgi:DNA repair ATPase RecN